MATARALRRQTALVTGVGRYGGIGAAICRALAQEGSDVFFTYWHPYDATLFPEDSQLNAAQFAVELRLAGVKVAFAEADLSEHGSAEKLFNNAKERLATPTILINNACYDIQSPFTKLNEEELDQHYAVNVRATTILCREFVKQSTGHIIIMTSGQSLGPMGEDNIAYTITKASAEMLALQLAPGFSTKGVTINALDPGPTDTGWMTEELKAQLISESKRGKVNTPTDVAKLAIGLLCDAQTTGKVIHAER